MAPGLLPRGIVIGFAIAAPVGPIGVLVIRRTLADGRLAGFVCGMGAATADAFYGSLAAFGLTFISGILIGQSGWIRLIGGLFLLYLGLNTVRVTPGTQAAPAGPQGLWRGYLSTCVLTLTNPATIISFAAVFAGVGLAGVHAAYASALLLVVGVFLGSSLWWFLLSGGMSVLRRRVSPAGMRWINRLSGTVLVAFGAAAILSVTGSLL